MAVRKTCGHKCLPLQCHEYFTFILCLFLFHTIYWCTKSSLCIASTCLSAYNFSFSRTPSHSTNTLPLVVVENFYSSQIITGTTNYTYLYRGNGDSRISRRSNWFPARKKEDHQGLFETTFSLYANDVENIYSGNNLQGHNNFFLKTTNFKLLQWFKIRAGTTILFISIYITSVHNL